MKQRGVGFVFLLTVTVVVTMILTVAVTATIANWRHSVKTRYYLQTEKMPNGMVTSVIDSKTNTQLLYIAELSLEPPSISVLPISRLDVKSVSVSPIGKEDVMVVHSEDEHRDRHTVTVSEPSPGPTSTLTNFDVNHDSIAEMRVVRFLMENRITSYIDLDVDGIFDAQEIIFLKSESERSACILVGQT